MAESVNILLQDSKFKCLTSVPMEESLATEHSSELLRDALEEFLDGSGIANEGG